MRCLAWLSGAAHCCPSTRRYHCASTSPCWAQIWGWPGWLGGCRSCCGVAADLLLEKGQVMLPLKAPVTSSNTASVSAVSCASKRVRSWCQYWLYLCETQLQACKRQNKKSNVNLTGSADMCTMCKDPSCQEICHSTRPESGRTWTCTLCRGFLLSTCWHGSSLTELLDVY